MYHFSHIDNFERRHENRCETSRLLWSYGAVPADGTLIMLLFGGDPTTVKFDVGKMRSHLYSCLQSGKFDHPFPKIEGKHEHSLLYKLLLEVPVYCVCRMHHFEGDDEVRELQMADCDRCHQWYHRSCLAVPDYVFKQKNKFWFCSKC